MDNCNKQQQHGIKVRRRRRRQRRKTGIMLTIQFNACSVPNQPTSQDDYDGDRTKLLPGHAVVVPCDWIPHHIYIGIVGYRDVYENIVEDQWICTGQLTCCSSSFPQTARPSIQFVHSKSSTRQCIWLQVKLTRLKTMLAGPDLFRDYKYYYRAQKEAREQIASPRWQLNINPHRSSEAESGGSLSWRWRRWGMFDDYQIRNFSARIRTGLLSKKRILIELFGGWWWQRPNEGYTYYLLGHRIGLGSRIKANRIRGDIVLVSPRPGWSPSSPCR